MQMQNDAKTERKKSGMCHVYSQLQDISVTAAGLNRHTSYLFRVGVETGSLAWEASALTRRLKTAAASAPLEIRGVRLSAQHLPAGLT